MRALNVNMKIKKLHNDFRLGYHVQPFLRATTSSGALFNFLAAIFAYYVP